MAEAPEETPAAPEIPASEGCGVGGSWWGGLVQVAKEKSASALQFVKNDITEFTSIMHSDSESFSCNVRSKMNHETAVAATERVKHGVSMLLDGIKTVLIIPPEDMDEDDAEPVTVSSSQHIFDKAKARLHAVQIDPGTYCHEPTGSRAGYEAWKKSFELDGKKGDISELLVANVQVRALYTQMVPSSVSHADFWQRYFYKLYQLQQEEQRRADLKKRADVVQEETDLAWDDEDDWENMEGNGSPSSKKDSETKSDATVSDLASASSDRAEGSPQIDKDSVKTDSATTDDKHSTPSDATDAKTTDSTSASLPDGGVDMVTSPTDTTSSLSTTTDSSNKDMDKDSSAETLTIVSAETPSSDDMSEEPVTLEKPRAQDEQDMAAIKTKEKGDIVLVGEHSGSEGTSPSSSESNSHVKESLDEDWEKDFDIEVTEEDLQQVQEATGDLAKENTDGDDDWENWE